MSCHRYYTANQVRFRSPDLFEAQHILLNAARNDEAAYGQALDRAEAVLAEIQAVPDRFEALARALSDCPSAQDGGRLGQVVRGETTPEFEAASIRHLLDTADVETWLDLIGRMSRSPQPGVAALTAILARAFPIDMATHTP